MSSSEERAAAIAKVEAARAERNMGRTVDYETGAVAQFGRTIGKIHYPFEKDGMRVRRSTWELVIAGRRIGRYSDFQPAADAAMQWQPQDEVDWQMLGARGAELYRDMQTAAAVR